MSDQSVTPSAAKPLCPSAAPKPGAILLGVLGPGGRTAYLPQVTRVDRDLLDGFAAGGPLGDTYRFASPCMTSGCVYWTQDRCHVPDVVRRDLGVADVPAGADLPNCSIRPACRWWQQDGAAACAICPLVVTQREPEPAAAS